MALAISIVVPSSTFKSCSSLSSTLSLSPSLPLLCNSSSSLGYWVSSSFLYKYNSKKRKSRYASVHYSSSSFTSLICRAAEYKFPDPIPEFANSETEKFRSHLMKKLSKKDLYGDSLEEVVGICTEIFTTFLHTEYGGPGTLLVEPFIDMADTLNERGLPRGPQAARAAVKWAQAHVDKDWKEWTNGDSNQ